jgi:gliding motility-associated-like protein
MKTVRGMRLFYVFLLATLLVGNVVRVAAQVSANFTVDDVEGCAPFLAQFTDQSSSTAGNIVSWQWDLGGQSSILQNPARFFPAGTYTICLTVRDNAGNQDTECKTNYIRSFASPDVHFAASPQSGCIPLTVTFDDQTVLGSAPITSYQWLFGDGTSSNQPNPTHIYTSAPNSSTYPVTLIVTDANGCTDLLKIDDFIAVSPKPVANFTATPNSGCNAPLSVTFQNQSTPTVGISAEWNFGDGSAISTAISPTHTYTSEGVYDVTLIITVQATGCKDTLFVPEAIGIGKDGISFSLSQDLVCTGNEIVFTDLTPGNVSNWQWNFGDGTTSTEQNPTHIYTVAGCYDVIFRATVNGCVATVTSPTCINVQDGVDGSYTATNTSGCSVPHTANFQNTTVGAASILWDFGDGTTSTQNNPVHTFNAFGSYPITLIVRDNTGCIDTVRTETVLVEPIYIQISSNIDLGCAPITVHFNDETQSVSPIVSWQWTFPGGTPNTSTAENPTVDYNNQGVYDVILQVTNSFGCTATHVFNNYIKTGGALNVDFDAVPRQNCAEDPIQFIDLSSAGADEWYWEFGDGAFSEDENPSHEYLDTGYMEVCLTVFDRGCPTKVCKDSFIYILPPIARLDVIQSCHPDSFYIVIFDDNSLGGDVYHWDFGVPGITNDTANTVDAYYIYPQRGTYTVTLTIYNEETQCYDETTRTFTIAEPIAAFQVEPIVGCVPHALTVTNESIDAVKYQWSVSPGVILRRDSLRIPFIFFRDTGYYRPITLTITDVNGCTDTQVFDDSIFISDVYPKFIVSDLTGCAPLPVGFTDRSESYVVPIVSWEWNFGDGSPHSFDQNPTHTYLEDGLFDVTLVIENEIGCRDSIVRSKLINPTYPAVNFQSDTFACPGQTIQFFEEADALSGTYLWDFGDGTTAVVPNPVHVYNTADTFSVCLTVTDINNCDSTYCKNIYIVNTEADFTQDTTFAPCPTLTVQFTDTSSNAVAWLWDFGDGNVSDDQFPINTYVLPGVYDVMLIVTGPSGCRDTLFKPKLIKVGGPIGDFSFDPKVGCVPLPVDFYIHYRDASLVYIAPGDGGLPTYNVPFSNQYQNDTFTYTLNIPGVFYPIIRLQDDNGCVLTYTTPDSIVTEALTFNYTLSDSLACDNAQITYTSTVNSSAPITELSWYFPGGNPSISSNPTQLVDYDTSGIYGSTLIVANNLCRDTLTDPDGLIVGGIPLPDFIMSADTGCTDLSIQFINQSSLHVGFINRWHWDFGDGDTSNVQNPIHVYTLGGSYTVTLSVYTNYGCFASTTKPILALPSPLIEVGPDATYCLNGSYTPQVSATSGTTITWSPAVGLSCTDCLNPTINTQQTTTYTVTATAPNGCTATDQLTVTVIPYPYPTVTLTTDTFVCQPGSVVQLLATGGSTPTSYQWDTSRLGLSCYDACFNPFASPTTNTVYVVTVYGQGGCAVTDSVLVNIRSDLPNQIAGNDRYVCQGGSVQLTTASGLTGYFWTPSNGLSCVNCPNPVAAPVTTTTYYISADDPTGCELRDTITVFVLDNNTVNAGNDITLCRGETVQLNGSSIVAGTVQWSPTTGLSNPNILNPTVSPTSNITYTLSFTSDQCTVLDSVRLTVLTKTDIAGADYILCLGDTIQLQISGDANTFAWTPTTYLSNSTIPNPLCFAEQTTLYTVVGQLGTCLPDTAAVQVHVMEKPDIELATPQNIIYLAGTPVQLGVIINDTFGLSHTYYWTPSDYLNCTDCPNPVSTPDSATIQYNILVTNEIGCEATLPVNLRPLADCAEEQIFLPNAFSPNADGQNDILYVRSTSITSINIFRIYNRWGELLFETSNITKGWDGTFNGKPQNPGVYVYYVQAPCGIDGSEVFKKGNVTLLR